MATHAPITPPETTQSRPEWPPIIELGRLLAATNAEHNRQDDLAVSNREDTIKSNLAERAMVILHDRRQALHLLIASLPARSLADAAVQLDIAGTLADDLYANEHDSRQASRLGKRILQIALSTLPIVAKEAGLDMEAMRWSSTEWLFASHFPEGAGA